MKRIAITQRVDVVESYGERRDALDQRWIKLLMTCGVEPVVVPNDRRFVSECIRGSVEGVLLTGGNTLGAYGGAAPERDQVEVLLLERAISSRMPVLGVCHGMQVIQHHYGVKLNAVQGHVATRHKLTVNESSRHAELLLALDTVNAFHDWAANYSTDNLKIAASTDQGVVMAIEHQDLPIFGQMWHSEREDPFVESELALIRSVLC